MPELDALTIAIVAIVISVLSLLVATGTLIWNFAVQGVRPRLRVRVHLRVASTGGARQPFVLVSAVNEGPGSVRIQPFVVVEPDRGRSDLPKSWTIVVVPDEKHVSATDTSKPVDAGEEVRLVVPYDASCFLGASKRIGVQDSSGRITWAKSSDVRKARRQHFRDFPEANVRFIVPEIY